MILPDHTNDSLLFKVVVNADHQYATWQAERENAVGWMDAGFKGSLDECMDYIEGVSTIRRRKPDNN